MTRHLSPQEFIDALDGVLASERTEHLAACDACTREVTELRDLTAETQAVPAPEPSPLFWDHFSTRVREATAAEPPGRATWWETAWRPVAALSAVAGAVALTVMISNRPHPAAVPPATEPGSAEAVAAIERSETTVELVSALAGDLTWEEATVADLASRRGVGALALTELSEAQQRELMRIIQEGLPEMEQR